MEIALFMDTHGLGRRDDHNWFLQPTPATEMRPVQIAQRAERHGFHSLWFSDHVTLPLTSDSGHVANPESRTRAYPPRPTMMDGAVVMGAIAAATERIKMSPSVLISPYRGPLNDARQFATVDVLSKGRLTAGVGVGWMSEEILLLGGPPFAERAKASDEYIEAFRELWTSEAPEQRGSHTDFRNLMFAPKTAQKPHAPIWVGGETKAARRRAGRLGDGWYPVANNPQLPLDAPDLYGEALTHVQSAAENVGKDANSITGALLAIYCSIGSEQEGRDGGRQTFTGSAQAIIDDIAQFEEQGLEHFLIGGDGSDLEGTNDRLEQFAAEIMANFVCTPVN